MYKMLLKDGYHYTRCSQAAEHEDNLCGQHSFYSTPCQEAVSELHKAAQCATRAFAKLNGWNVARKDFPLYMLLPHKKWHLDLDFLLRIRVSDFDHAQFFKSRGHPIAVVAHNYGGPPWQGDEKWPADWDMWDMIELSWSWYALGYTRAFLLLAKDR